MNGFNRNLILVTIALVLVIAARLFVAALETDNWRGFTYSLLHVVIVAVGTYFTIRKRHPNA